MAQTARVVADCGPVGSILYFEDAKHSGGTRPVLSDRVAATPFATKWPIEQKASQTPRAAKALVSPIAQTAKSSAETPSCVRASASRLGGSSTGSEGKRVIISIGLRCGVSGALTRSPAVICQVLRSTFFCQNAKRCSHGREVGSPPVHSQGLLTFLVGVAKRASGAMRAVLTHFRLTVSRKISTASDGSQ
jgi:hypothetical protein